jgi:Phage-like element PBSX protein XtrA
VPGVEMNKENVNALIDELREDHCYVVKDGMLIAKQLPPHGKTTIITYHGKVDRFEFNTSEKV